MGVDSKVGSRLAKRSKSCGGQGVKQRWTFVYGGGGLYVSKSSVRHEGACLCQVLKVKSRILKSMLESIFANKSQFPPSFMNWVNCNVAV